MDNLNSLVERLVTRECQGIMNNLNILQEEADDGQRRNHKIYQTIETWNTLLADLPDLPLENIVKNLSHADLCNLALTNRRMKSFALNPNLFSNFGENECLARKIKEKGIENFLSESSHRNPTR